jgi:predicted nucleic acid-binding protein
VWSEELLSEAQRSLVEKKGLPPDAARRWVDYLRCSFPAGRVDIEGTPVPDLGGLTSDPADLHVCALAVAAGADYLFTHDRGYLRDGLSRYGVQVIAPDAFLADAFDSNTPRMLRRLELQASTWEGGRPISELLDALERAGALAFVATCARRSDLRALRPRRRGRGRVARRLRRQAAAFPRRWQRALDPTRIRRMRVGTPRGRTRARTPAGWGLSARRPS